MHWTRTFAPLWVGLTACIALTGCEGASFDPLDSDAIGDVANDMGDAKGSAFSGTYDLVVTQLDCDCPAVSALDFPDGGAGAGLEPEDSVDPCSEIEVFYDRPPDAGGIVDVEQSDGLLVWTSWVPPLSGPVDADGEFTVAGYEDVSELFVEARILTRVEGRHHNIDEFTAILRHRVVADIGDLALDCRATHQVEGTRVPDIT